MTGRLFGIRSDLVTIACYLISSCLAAIAGLILSGYVGLVDNWVGQGYELDSIVACVVGRGIAARRPGSILGALTGAAIIVILANEVLLLGVPIQSQSSSRAPSSCSPPRSTPAEMGRRYCRRHRGCGRRRRQINRKRAAFGAI